MRALSTTRLLLIPFLLAGCGSSDDSSSSANGTGGDSSAPYGHGSDGKLLDPPGSGGAAGAANGNAGTSNGTAGAGAISDGFSPESPLGGFFRYGVNGGFPNPKWTDPDLAQLESERGCNSQRISLPEAHLERWGYQIELPDLAKSKLLGLTGQVGFLTTPIRAHSTAPASAADWELVNYLPKNLYEPILLDNGKINPDNFWANYVYEAVKTYQGTIKVWEIWNEPDWVSDWRVTGDWKTRAPTAQDLPRFNGSLYDYVRMLRVSKVAAQLADPKAKIATGGLGYSSFLGAVLRYTDNPVDGSVTSKFPFKGGAYVDVLSFHHYPVYTQGNSDDAVDGYLNHVDEFSLELTQAKANIDGWENTETGAPHAAIGKFPGGTEYARNYLLKVMVSAQARGIDGADWFVLSDAETPANTDDPYKVMGLYLPVGKLATTAEAQTTETGIAYATLGKLLGKARFDAAATTALKLPKSVRGAAFVTASGKPALVLWARIEGAAETASASLPNTKAWTRHGWDWSKTTKTTTVAAGTALTLDATPSIFITP